MVTPDFVIELITIASDERFNFGEHWAKSNDSLLCLSETDLMTWELETDFF